MSTSEASRTADLPLHLDQLSRHIFRAASIWKTALDANIVAEGLDRIAPTGSGHVLFELFARDGQTVGRLAKKARVSHVAILHVIKRIETAGLVERKTCSEDRRATRVWLTPAGRALEPRMQALHERNLAQLIGILGKKDAARLGGLLERLMAGLSEETLPPNTLPEG